MSVKEKLVELLHKGVRCPGVIVDCGDCPHYSRENACDEFGATADMLIANGVTVQEWISPIEYYPHKNEIILIHDIRGNTYVGPSINTPVDKVGYWMPLPVLPKGE